MTTNDRTALDRALAAVHPRRVVLTALALGAAAIAIVPMDDPSAKKKKKKKHPTKTPTPTETPTPEPTVTPSGPSWGNVTMFGSGPGAADTNVQDPTDVAISADGLTAWVADNDNHRIVVWTRPVVTSSNWSFSAKFGSEGSGNSNFLYPCGVDVSADGLTALVADPDNHRISVWTRSAADSTDWGFSTKFGTYGTGSGNFKSPIGVALSGNARTALVADFDNSRIAVWTRPDANSTSWSPSITFGSGPAGNLDNFYWPRDVAVSANGLTAWVADLNNHRITVWSRPDTDSTSWSPSTSFGSGPGSNNDNLDAPFGVAVSDDTLTAWVADSANNRISVWTRPDTGSISWTPSARFGSSGSGSSSFNTPKKVAVSADGLCVWVADSSNNRISIWDYA